MAQPEPGSHEVLLQVRAVGICGSDVHLFRGDHPYRVFPLIYGHEFSATVTAIGADVQEVARGDYVVVEPLLNCGHCYPCRIGRYNCCEQLRVIGVHVNGAFAESVVVPANRVHRVSPTIPPEVAALCEPFSIGVQAVGRAAVDADDRVVVLGAGPIGLTVLAVAKSRGARVAVVDLLDNRLELARRIGADTTINAATSDVPQAVRAFTDGDGASVVVEATGSARAMESTLDLVAFAGRVVLLGVTTKPVTWHGLDFTRKELTILGSRNSANCFATAVQFVTRHPDTVAALTTHHLAFDQVVQAFELADSQPDQVCKIVVTVGG